MLLPRTVSLFVVLLVASRNPQTREKLAEERYLFSQFDKNAVKI